MKPAAALRARLSTPVVDPTGRSDTFGLEVETDQLTVKLFFDGTTARQAAHALFAGIRSLDRGAPV